MKVTVRYFGSIAEKVGKSAEMMSFDDDAKLSFLQKDIEKRYGEIISLTYRLSVNKKLVEEVDLADGDEVAFLPPFAGG